MSPLPRYRVPEPDALVSGLTRSLRDGGFPADGLTVLERRLNPYVATHASEIVACRLPDGRVLRLLCKYGSASRGSSWGHRGGILYEANVYREVLRRQPCTVPELYGTYEDESSDEAWLVLEHLGEFLRVSKAGEESMVRAARWLGRFHAATGLRNGNGSGNGAPAFLKRYDDGFYAGWADRTAEFVTHDADHAPWVAALCADFRERMAVLLAAPQAVIHGEYVMENVLVRDGVVYPTDWESAAVGPGEIDLAALTDCWSNEIARRCELEYQRARWPDGAPESFPHVLALARLYWPLRWLGEREAWMRRGNRGYFRVLRRAGRRLGLL